MRSRLLRPLASASLGLIVSLALGACAPFSVLGQLAGATSTPNPQGAPAGFEPYYSQSIEWRFCGVNLQCGNVMAPTDWSDPQSLPIELSMVRHLADTSNVVGDLFVNPGGPGESAAAFVATLVDRAVTSAVSDVFNIVGLDPRGVGGSTPVTCYTDPVDMDNLLYGIPRGERESEEWNADITAATSDFGQACLRNTGDVLGFLDTGSAARDMDMVRAAMGNSFLNFVGYSYGTLLGATYAELFPERVGRMVLDGAVDPTVPPAESTFFQALGFESALNAYIVWCVEGGDCPIGDSADAAAVSLSQLIKDMDASPLVNDDGRRLGGTTLVTAILWPLYDDTSWGYLSEILASTLQGDPALAFESADGYNGRASDGTYPSNSTEAFVAITCVDSAPVEANRVRELNSALLVEAPILGPFFQVDEEGCSGWPISPKGSTQPLRALGAPSLLVIGTTNDPATPYEGARSLAEQLSSAHLVTYDGEGHTAYNRGVSCVDDIVDDYLIHGSVPAEGVTC